MVWMNPAQIIGFLSIGAAFFYFLVHLCLLAGMKRTKRVRSEALPRVSIIVAARNEEASVRELLQCLLRQTYPDYEIIIVNDRSTDGTAGIIAEIQKENPLIRRIDITAAAPDMPAKKNALRAGIEESRGEVLCFTDADCCPPPTWLEELAGHFEPDVGLVAGYSPYQIPINASGSGIIRALKKSFFSFIAYEEFRAAIWSAASIGLNAGWLCTGRNLAYRRAVYDQLGGFEKIKMSVSGDDDLFLQLVRRNTDWNIRYAVSPRSYVPTIPPANLPAFIEQRKRHFSAAKYFSLPMKLFFFLYHSSNLILVLSIVFYLAGLLSLPSLGICMFAKLAADAVLIASSMRIFGSYQFRHTYTVFEALYVLYNTIIGPLGLFRRFEWKPN
jgi:cellulose synthase/poly-beta-1,6-N-acetylglucosamine synthase-like glycosyltransferase